MNDKTLIVPSGIYHIYNRANGSENLYLEQENYYYFLRLFAKRINPFFDVYAYVLLPNHFHTLVRAKRIEELNEDLKEGNFLHKRNPYSQVLSNFFNAYTKAFNKRYRRKGSLFMRPFKRVLVDDKNYFLKMVHYIHANPVHHGFCQNISDYTHSSYHTFLTSLPTKLCRNYVINQFGDLETFIEFHQQPIKRKIDGTYFD